MQKSMNLAVRLVERLRHQAKQLIYATPILYSGVARIRAKQVRALYDECVALYGNLEDIPIEDKIALLKSRSAGAISRFLASSRPRILFLGTDELQDRSGMLQGLQSIGVVTEYRQLDGTYGRRSADEHALSEAGALGARLVSYVESAARGGAPWHLIIGQLCGGYVPPGDLAMIRRQNELLIVNICMDDRHTFYPHTRAGMKIGVSLLCNSVDLALTAAPEAVGWHMKLGSPALFWPEASDPAIFAADPRISKQTDVLFVGSRYGRRGAMVHRLKRDGIDVQCYGDGWPEGRLPLASTPDAMRKAKINLGFSGIAHCTDLHALKLRDFDAAMVGSFYLTEDHPDLHRVFAVGSEIETYSSYEECLEKCRHYLAHEEARELIASNGAIRARREHTWQHRFGDFLEFLKLSIAEA